MKKFCHHSVVGRGKALCPDLGCDFNGGYKKQGAVISTALMFL